MVRSVFSFRSLFYIVFAVLLIALLLYVRFPAEKFKTYSEQHIERLSPGSECNISRFVYDFPFSAVLEAIEITRTINGQETEMIVDRLAVTPELPQFWKTFRISGEMYSGLFEARLDIDREAETFQLTDIYFEGLEAGSLAESIGISDRKISGSFEFAGSYQASTDTPGDGVGTGVAQILSGSMSLLQPILSLSTIEYDHLAVDLRQQKGTVTFANGELAGKDIVASFIGEMQLDSPLLMSNININGYLEPDAAFLRNHPEEQQFVQRLLEKYEATALPFKIGGTVQRPLFRFST
ncbi:MAG: type II secretion system protein GspN [Desulforhopalus sp.]